MNTDERHSYVRVRYLQSSQGIHQANTRSRDRSQHQDDTHRNPCTVLVANCTKDKTHANVETDSANICRPNILGSQVKIGLDLRKERSDSEPDEEGNEEGPPSKVEGPHVRPSKRAQPELRGLVVLVRIHSKRVLSLAILLLDFGALHNMRSVIRAHKNRRVDSC